MGRKMYFTAKYMVFGDLENILPIPPPYPEFKEVGKNTLRNVTKYGVSPIYYLNRAQ
jgi:hypothetical protein